MKGRLAQNFDVLGIADGKNALLGDATHQCSPRNELSAWDVGKFFPENELT